MNTDDLIATLRRNASIDDTHLDYPSNVLLQELQDSQTTKFQRLVLEARSGYWLQHTDIPLASGAWQVRIPPRSIALSKVELGETSGVNTTFVRVPRIEEGHADLFEPAVSSLGRPRFWVSRGDKLQLLPSADNTGFTLRVWYYLRPPRLVAQQSSGTIRGQVIAVDTVARTLTVNAIPWNQTTSAAIVSGQDTIDVVHPDGWHELALVGASQTWSGNVITVGGSDNMDAIQVGDFVRAADQTDWPSLPDDFHRCLVDVTSSKVLIQMDYQQKASGFVADVQADLQRFSELIGNRALEEPRKIRAALPFLRRRW